jgi:predicted phosphodiesterase
MKVAVIGDIQANLPALEAVLAHARQQGVGAIWNVGDFLGYGPSPDEVVQRLRQEFALSTIGSYDRKVLRFKKRESKWRQSKPLEEYLALKWAYENLSKTSRKYLRFLSREIRMKARGRRVLLTHSPAKDLEGWAREARADVVVFGDAGEACSQQMGHILCLTPGSVGWPGSDGEASYVTLHLRSTASFAVDAELEVVHHRVVYDVEALAAAIRDPGRGIPEMLARTFLQGLGLGTEGGGRGEVE